MNNTQVVERFLAGKSGKGSNLQTDGSTLWSYDYVLAWYHNDEHTILYNTVNTGIVLGYDGLRSRTYDAAYSPSTNRHRSLLWSGLRNAGFKETGVQRVPGAYEYVRMVPANAR